MLSPLRTARPGCPRELNDRIDSARPCSTSTHPAGAPVEAHGHALCAGSTCPLAAFAAAVCQCKDVDGHQEVTGMRSRMVRSIAQGQTQPLPVCAQSYGTTDRPTRTRRATNGDAGASL